jgi:hypothetical protein
MKIVYALAAGMLMLCASSDAFAYTATSKATISRYNIGWGSPNLSVYLDATFENPDNCSDPSSYMMDYASPSIQAVTAAVMSAHATNAQVQLILNECISNRPQIVGINV